MGRETRGADELRPVQVEYDVQPNAAASLFMRMGGTHVLCSVSVEEGVPPFLKDSGRGWITAEYGMLPGATNVRVRRESVAGRSGRTFEIQRFIGRSLRTMIDLAALGENTLRVDCDVINADGGTRCASITGGALAVRRALMLMHQREIIPALPHILPVAAVSAGMVAGEALLDLDYSEDHVAEVDANFVMAPGGRWLEVQATAEGAAFDSRSFSAMARLAERGIGKLLQLWDE